MKIALKLFALFTSAVILNISPCWDKSQRWRKTHSHGHTQTHVMEEALASLRSSVSWGPLSLSSHSCTVVSFPPLRPSVKVEVKKKAQQVSMQEG